MSAFSFRTFSAGRCPLWSCESSLDGAQGHCMGRLYNVLILYSEADEISQWRCLFTPWRRCNMTTNKAGPTKSTTKKIKRSTMPTSPYSIIMLNICDSCHAVIFGIVKWQTSMHPLMLTTEGCRSGPLVKASDSLFPITECSCRVVFLFVQHCSISATSTLPLETHTQNTQATTHNLDSCAPNCQLPAVCNVTNEYCHLAKHLLALLLLLCTVVQCFVLVWFVFLACVKCLK